LHLVGIFVKLFLQWESRWYRRRDGRTDMKLRVAFREYAKAPKTVVHFYDKPTVVHL